MAHSKSSKSIFARTHTRHDSGHRAQSGTQKEEAQVQQVRARAEAISTADHSKVGSSALDSFTVRRYDGIMLSRINSVLLCLIILVDGYVIAAPFAPQAWLWWQQHHTQTAKRLEEQLHPSQSDTPFKEPVQDSLIIPAISLSTPLHEGTDMYKELAQGVWHWPDGSSPDKGSNTVLIGHRFTYTNPRGIFYSLDKIRISDEIGVIWHGETYLYKVTETRIVPPEDTTIEAPTNQATLTLYTCTPLWWPKDRLVIIARQENA